MILRGCGRNHGEHLHSSTSHSADRAPYNQSIHRGRSSSDGTSDSKDNKAGAESPFATKSSIESSPVNGNGLLAIGTKQTMLA